MRIVIAPNALKSSLTASQAAKVIEEGVKEFDKNIETVLVPVADGGDGLVDVLQGALGGKLITCDVHDPLFRSIKASYTFVKSSKTAAIEMALASGIALLNDEEKNASLTTTFGTGELIKNAIKKGAKKIILGIGGSATNDAGIGMAAALGVKFYDEGGHELVPIGRELINIASIDISGILPEVKDVRFEVACDVDNPLSGINGAAYVYGKQKGASQEDIELLDKGLKHFAEVVKKQFGLNIDKIEGAGAAGGLGAGLVVFTDALLAKGIDLVFDAVGLQEKIKGADLVITAEGQIDFQTKYGKAPAGVGIIAKKYNIPCIALAGSIGEKIEELRDCGITATFSICPGPVTLDNAISHAEDYMKNLTREILYTFTALVKNK